MSCGGNTREGQLLNLRNMFQQKQLMKLQQELNEMQYNKMMLQQQQNQLRQ